MDSMLAAFALPRYGLTSIFLLAFVSASLLPVASEPAVFGLVHLNPSLFWPAIVVATIGNTLGGMVNWWMGLATRNAVDRRHAGRTPDPRALRWLQRFGPRACLLSFLPVVGDPLCMVAGWLRMPLNQCTIYMVICKFARYLVMTWLMMQASHHFFGV